MKNLSRCLPIIVTLSAALGVSPAVQAKNWVCDTDLWDKAECWSPVGQPTAGETAVLNQSGTSDIVITYQNTLNPTDVLAEIRLEGFGGGVVRLEQTLDYALSASSLFVGRDGSGEYLQTIGTSNFADASLGARAGSDGRYDLRGSGAATFGGLLVGNRGNGTFVQTGGSNTVANLAIGAEAGGDGSYTLSGGTLTVGDALSRGGVVDVGRWGTGRFIQEADTVHTVYGDLSISRKAGPLGAPSTGTYTINGGTLNADNIEVGLIPQLVTSPPPDDAYPFVHEASDGHFIQNDGSVNVDSTLIVSTSGGALGRYELRGGSLTASNVINNDRFEYSGGSLVSNIENHALLAFSGTEVRTVTGSVSNVGETSYAQGSYQETKNGVVTLADGTSVSIGKDLTLDALGTLDIELDSSFFGFGAMTPWIDVGGFASIDGILDLTDISGWLPVDGDSWTILGAGTVSGMFDTVLYPTIPNWNWDLVYDYDLDKIVLTGMTSPVPIPPAVWLFGSGLLGLVGIARRRVS